MCEKFNHLLDSVWKWEFWLTEFYKTQTFLGLEVLSVWTYQYFNFELHSVWKPCFWAYLDILENNQVDVDFEWRLKNFIIKLDFMLSESFETAIMSNTN